MQQLEIYWHVFGDGFFCEKLVCQFDNSAFISVKNFELVCLKTV